MDLVSPLGSRWNRLVAYTADAWVFLVVASIGATFGDWIERTWRAELYEIGDPSKMIGLVFGFYFWGWAATFLNVGVLQGLTGASVGKHLMHLRVVCRDGSPIGVRRSLVRLFAHLGGFMTAYLSYAWALLDRERRAGHDWLAGTVVIRTGAIYPVKARVPTTAAQATHSGDQPARPESKAA